MAEFKVRTRDNSDPHGKPRVYFTCHPDDFESYYDDICEDIFSIRSIDCAIYHTTDMSEPLSLMNIFVDLRQVTLVVLPITRRLLTEDCRAMKEDIEFAKLNNIPILPFMMESGLDSLYSLPNKFGNTQYINPNSEDKTEIGYYTKLKKYLESAIIINETVREIRSSFTTYLFLSYRKKNRDKANELMKMIHAIPACRFVAIWYDEFLNVCDDFVADIDEAMAKSNLFILLVTPDLLEDGNFVMTDEYPSAVKKGMNILPVEMEKTDYGELCKKYPGIPPCVDPYHDDDLYDAIIKYLPGLKFSVKRPKSNEQNYLMGLAYLHGVDVEANVELAIELIERAAEGGMFKAMIMLYNSFRSGEYVNVDYERATYWAERLVDYCMREYGEYESITLTALNNLAVLYSECGLYDKALAIHQRVYAIRAQQYGEDSAEILQTLGNLAVTYVHIGNYQKAFELNEKNYLLRSRLYGEKHPDTLTALSNLASSYGHLRQYDKALELHKRVYDIRLEILGGKHPDTLAAMSRIAYSYSDLEQYDKAIELNKRVYILRCEVLGEKHPQTIVSLGNLAFAYGKLGDHIKEFELTKRAYDLHVEILGERHPDTLTCLNNLASCYGKLGDYKRALQLNEEVYALRVEVLGEEHPDTMYSINNLANTYAELGNYPKALELFERLYEIRRRVYGEDDPLTLGTKGDVELIRRFMSDGEDHRDGNLELQKKMVELGLRVYSLSRILHGDEHPDTIDALEKYANHCLTYGDHGTALEHFEKLYRIRVKVFGEEHPDTLKTKKMIDTIRQIIE